MRNFILFLAFSAVAFGQCGSAGRLIKNPLTGLWDCTAVVGAGTGSVTSVGLAGTANQITVTGATPITDSGSWTLSLPTAGVTLPGTTTIGILSAKQNVMDAVSFCSDAGSTDAYACDLTPAISTYVTGTHYRFLANTANTGAATVALNSLAAKTIVKVAGGITTALATNDIRVGQWVDVVYDGTNMQMQSTLGNAGGGGTPGGSDTQCQFNNSGAFGGITGCTTNGTTVTLASPIVTGTLTVGTSVTVTASSGDIVTLGKVTSGSGSGVAGADSYLQGTFPASFPTNSFSFVAPTSIPTAYQWKVPTADAAGAIVSDGAGTPGVLSIVGFSGTGNIAKVTSPTFVTPTLGVASATSVTATTLTASASLVASTAMTLSFIASGTQCLHVNSSGVVSGTGSDCGSGGGGGATAALDNLSAVSINANLGAQTGITAGTTTNPFSTLVFNASGTYGTGSIKFGGTPTANRTVTFPDATDTVAELGQANNFSAAQTITSNGITGVVTQTPAITLVNTTAATNVADQSSPCVTLSGNAWTGSASQQQGWCIQNITIGASGYLEFLSNANNGSFTNRLTLEPDGTLDVKSTLNVAGNVILTAGRTARSDFFQDRGATKGFLDTTISGFNFVNDNSTTGNVNEAIRAKASQTADLLQFLAAGGTTVLTKVDVSGNLTIVPQKSTTGTRYLCVDTAGLITSSASACSGT